METRSKTQHLRPPEPTPEETPDTCEKDTSAAAKKRRRAKREKLSSEMWSVKYAGKNGGYPCDVCGKSFITPSKLSRHYVKHSDEKPYCCDVCGKYFKHDITLANHKKSHTHENMYSCDNCGKMIRMDTSVLNRKPIHLKLGCSDWSKVFVDSYGRFTPIENQALHALFPCNVCGLRFSIESMLMSHKDVHTHGESAFQCDCMDESSSSMYDSSSQQQQQQQHQQEQQQQSSTFEGEGIPPVQNANLPVVHVDTSPKQPKKKSKTTGFFAGYNLPNESPLDFSKKELIRVDIDPSHVLMKEKTAQANEMKKKMEKIDPLREFIRKLTQ